MSSLSPNPDTQALIYDATTRQLERMRAMQYAYHQKFFHWIILNLILLIVLFLFPQGKGIFLIPFLLVTTGVQASFYLHFCDFARTHAQAMERKINQLLNQNILLGAKIENLYFYPHHTPKLSGFSFHAPHRFFSVFTLHWFLLWTFCFFLSLFYVWTHFTPSWILIYLAGATIWAIGNGLYLFWLFAFSQPDKKIAQFLDEQLSL